MILSILCSPKKIEKGLFILSPVQAERNILPEFLFKNSLSETIVWFSVLIWPP